MRDNCNYCNEEIVIPTPDPTDMKANKHMIGSKDPQGVWICKNCALAFMSWKSFVIQNDKDLISMLNTLLASYRS